MNKNNFDTQMKENLSGTANKQRNIFLECSDEELKEFFITLDNMPSPEKEIFFVEYCLGNSGLH